jgi:hypothetical protein
VRQRPRRRLPRSRLRGQHLHRRRQLRRPALLPSRCRSPGRARSRLEPSPRPRVRRLKRRYWPLAAARRLPPENRFRARLVRSRAHRERRLPRVGRSRSGRRRDRPRWLVMAVSRARVAAAGARFRHTLRIAEPGRARALRKDRRAGVRSRGPCSSRLRRLRVGRHLVRSSR